MQNAQFLKAAITLRCDELPCDDRRRDDRPRDDRPRAVIQAMSLGRPDERVTVCRSAAASQCRSVAASLRRSVAVREASQGSHRHG